MATINDIALKLGISKSTVSKALNNATDISEKMRKDVLIAAAELGYTNKRRFKLQKKLCVLIENMNCDTPNQFGYGIVRGFTQFAEEDGWVVETVPVSDEFQKMTPYSVFMMEHDYQAAFVLGFALPDPWLREFRHCKIPTVLYDNYVEGNPYVASVGCDSNEGFELAVKHLVSLGHKKIGLISGPLESYILRARYQAYNNALTKYQLEINHNYIGLEYYISNSTREYLPKLIDEGVTAILFSHDVRAFSALEECHSMGIRIPEDLSLIGFDDLPMAALTDPPLTTVRQDRNAIGKCGYYAITSLLNNVPIGSILLRAPLIIRGSCGQVH